MVNARLCETARLAFFFASPRDFDFLDYEAETSKCFECERETFIKLSYYWPDSALELLQWPRMSLLKIPDKSLTKEPFDVNIQLRFYYYKLL